MRLLTFCTSDGTVAVRAIADLEDHVHPGPTFRTSRSAPLRVTGNQSPGKVVVDAALRAVLSIEEHEIGQLVLAAVPATRPAHAAGADRHRAARRRVTRSGKIRGGVQLLRRTDIH